MSAPPTSYHAMGEFQKGCADPDCIGFGREVIISKLNDQRWVNKTLSRTYYRFTGLDGQPWTHIFYDCYYCGAQYKTTVEGHIIPDFKKEENNDS